ncbi:MAG: efflux RND transporter periplasmic adaptor subunit [Pirellulaceae bacterium]|nr:efflux RND transporter periplasmic adaptor subunit [Pirellulaceae bacterium]
MSSPENRPRPAVVVAPPRPPRQPSGDLGQRVRSLRLEVPENRLQPGKLVGWGLFALLVAGGGYWTYRTWFAAPSTAVAEATSPAAAPQDTTSLKPVLPATAAPRSSPAPAAPQGEVALESKGYIVPAHQILVSPKVSGMILKLDVEEGRPVTKGDVLAVLESTDYQADFDRAKAAVRLAAERVRELDNGTRPEEIQQAAAEVAETEAQLVQLVAEFRRASDLRKNSSITQQEFEISESQYRAMQQRLERQKFRLQLLKLGEREERREIAKAELAQAEADLVKAEWRLGNCTIRAPISGTILKKNAEEGNIVNPIAFNGSFSLCEMADLSDLEVDLNIQERDVSLVKVGQRCRVRSEAWPDRVYEGQVSRLMPIADRAKGAIPVRVKLSIPPEEEGQFLKPEMGAIVTFLNDLLPESTTTATP